MAAGSRPKSTRAQTDQTHDHAPAHPSGLRQAYTLGQSPSNGSLALDDDDQTSPNTSPQPTPRIHLNDESVDDLSLAGPSLPTHQHDGPSETTGLLRGVLDFREHAHEGPCNHGTFSPRPGSPVNALDADMRPTSPDSIASWNLVDGMIAGNSSNKDWKRRWAARLRSKKMSTSSALLERHGVQDTVYMSAGPLIHALAGFED
jgi:hypothetical protein